LITLNRVIILLYEKISGNQAERKILFVGLNEKTKAIAEAIRQSSPGANLFGVVSTRNDKPLRELELQIVGNVDYLDRIILDNKIDEVIITDENITVNEIMKLFLTHKDVKAKIHIAGEYEELIAARIINDILGIEPTLPVYNIFKFRYRLIKRIMDIIISLFLLTIGLPLVYLLMKKDNDLLKRLILVLKGEQTLIGLYPIDKGSGKIYKDGLLSLAYISGHKMLTQQSIEKLNDYYLRHFSLSLDTDILLKYIFRNKKWQQK
jgi:hypothetical protein